MKIQSIRVRLLIASGAMMLLALIASGVSISLIFQRHVENRVQQELEKHYIQLMSVVSVQPDGTIKLSKELTDPRFTLPLSGLYWQIDLHGKPLARSKSLWDERLNVPTPPVDSVDTHIHALAGPDGQNLFSLEKAVFLDHAGTEQFYVVTVGVERGEISDTVLSLSRDLAPALGVLGFVLLLATWVQLTLGLKPLSTIENAVHGIREGGRSRVDEAVATEVKPLVSELNALLAANEERNKAARHRAADLAHGLRTPLAILGSLSRTVEDAGMRREGCKIRLQTEHMRQQVERELAKALSSTEEVADWVGLRAGIERLVRVVSMAPSATRLMWDVDIPRDAAVLITRNDFNEIVGNILENAQKWARSKVVIGLDGPTLRIEDDGHGVVAENVIKLTERGFTTGDGRTSNGLGLAIVQELVNKNRMTLRFSTSQHGGLSVQLKLLPHMLRRDEEEIAMHM
jgi:signal transduction histidine kinase